MPPPTVAGCLVTYRVVPWRLSMRCRSWSLTSGIDVQAVAAGESLRAASWRGNARAARGGRAALRGVPVDAGEVSLVVHVAVLHGLLSIAFFTWGFRSGPRQLPMLGSSSHWQT